MLIPDDQIWIVVLGFIIAFVLAFGIGANDVANSFGTSVGSKVLTLKQACILATIFEILGSILLGAKVSDTIRKMVSLPEMYQNESTSYGVKLMMMGQLSSLSGACIWMLIATFFKLPVSGSHSIVGAVVGFALVIQGLKGIKWSKLGLIVASWFISPILSGSVSVLTFFLIDHFILKKIDPLEPGLKFLPFIYSITILINVFSIFISGPPLLGFDKIPLYGTFIISIGLGILTCLIVRFAVVPYLRKMITKKCQDVTKKLSNGSNNMEGNGQLTEKLNHPHSICNVEENYQLAEKSMSCLNNNNEDNNQITDKSNQHDKNVEVHYQIPEKKHSNEYSNQHSNQHSHTHSHPHPHLHIPGLRKDSVAVKIVKKFANVKDKPEQNELFSGLQILTAVFGGFAHGGNDVSNAIGPLVGLWIYGITQNISSSMQVPIWILLYGGLGITVGLWIWGRRVIKTMGDELTTITPSSGVCIELGSAITVTIASNVGLPISTTHCKVGSIVAVGRYRSNENVDWKIFRNICFAWFITLPVTGGVSALIMFCLKTWAL